MRNSGKKVNFLIFALIVLIVIGLVVIGYLLYKMNTLESNNVIAESDYSNKGNNQILDNQKIIGAISNNNGLNTDIIDNNNNDNDRKSSEKRDIKDWELVLVNYQNSLPEDFEVELSSIDKIRKFDSRAIQYLNDMILDMKSQGVKGIWVQSSYRSIETQTEVFNEEIDKQIRLRKIKRGC